ncbi:MAG: hypothetical protein IJ507_04010 [Clostridia bacterium]|nr:hypothetical protein [Clostridia bacterium]
MSMACVREAFLHPADEFTVIPFWFWNDEMSETELRRQIHDFHAKGVSGFVIHPRKGLPKTIPYLGDSFMHYVRFAVEEAAGLGMQVILYDEAMYPSGSAHGMIVKENPALASRCLMMERSDAPVASSPDIIAVCAAVTDGQSVSSVEVLQPENGVYTAPENRTLLCFRIGFSHGTIRGVHENEDDGEPDAPASADLLNPEAVRAFIRLTHERYWEVLKEHFGKTVIAMFTDEPDITGRNARPGCKPWTDGFMADFEAQGCTAADLPALWLDAGARTEEIRRRYRLAQNHRMIRTYYAPLAQWCEEHHIALTGHPAKGWDIGLLSPFQLPGQDVVWRYVGPGNGIAGDESVLAKCASDAARHLGRRRNLNECFGCCGPDGVQWAFTMDEMKWYADWLLVRGTNLLCPHAFFYSLRDGRGDERPPDVGPNNLWWPWYDQFSLYARRLCWLNTDSVNAARVAVLCEEDCLPWRSCVPLYENQIEFNYLSLEQLAACTVENGRLAIRNQRYDVLLIESAPLEGAAAERAEEFRRQGGVILTSPDLARLPADLTADRPQPMLRVTHVTKGGAELYLLVNEGEETIDCRLTVSVSGAAQWWNAWTGEITPAAADAQGRFALHLPRRESIILAVDPAGDLLTAEPTPAKTYAFRPLTGLTLRCTPMGGGESFTVTTDAQGCLPPWPDTGYSGWMACEAELTLSAPAKLRLGGVSGMTRLFVNGVEQGMQMWSPHVYDLPAGTLRLRIEVCNTMANAYEPKPLPSGILGAVELGE